ncbi:MAG TPA: hypothetical protein VFU02_21865 [Polyangiaceae bacterium]|nr:hypothetical protein [Polyangiaceae bacterium]
MKQRRAQDLIETVAPPRGRASIAKAGDAPGSKGSVDTLLQVDVAEDDGVELEGWVSPDDVPTKRPPWSDPAESRERVILGVQIPPVKKNA